MISTIFVLWKACCFLLQGNNPRKALWLARTRAPAHAAYRHFDEMWLRSVVKLEHDWNDIEIDGQSFRSKSVGLDLTSCHLLAGSFFRQLRDAAAHGWSYEVDGQVILARHGGLALRLETAEEAGILHEVFVEHCYALAAPGMWRVLDIGGNAGFAALSFACRPNVSEVLSFEPFAPTAAAYRRNMLLNPGVSGKMSLREVGLSDRNGDVTVSYNPDLRGSMSLEGAPGWTQTAGSSLVEVALQVRRASDELRAWLEGSDLPVMAKIDCEGAEYQILPDLATNGLLERFTVLIIEWHGARHRELCDLLVTAGFAVHATPTAPDGKTLGLVYAQRIGK